MRPRLLYPLCLLFFFGATTAFAQGPTNNRLLFIANMDGAQEVPSVNTAARGVASVLLSEDRATMTVYGVFSGLSGPVAASHFHNATEGVNGGVFINLSTNVSGNRLHAELGVDAGFIEKALKGAVYLNVHTAANPGGEIRGQLKLSTDAFFAAQLTGGQETPPVTTTAGGVGVFSFSPGHSKASYKVVFNGLSGAMTAAHIHKAAAGVGGGVITPLMAGSPGTLSGDLDLSTLPGDFTANLENQLLYMNVHTAANPAGEIRGQLLSLGPIAFGAFLNGDQEVPPVSSSAVGVAAAGLSPTLDSLAYFVGVSGLTPTAAHFHPGAAGVNGGVLAPLQPTAMPNIYGGKIALNPQQVTDFLNSGIYVNVHTAANPGGEIRGQVEPLLRRAFAFDLCGQQEVPANASAGIGSAVVTTDRLNTNLDYLYIVDGLSGPATAAHIHGEAPIGVNAGVLMPVNLPNPVSSGQADITGDLVVKMEAGETYLNVHTAANPGGEIRGQVLRKLSCDVNTAVFDVAISGLEVFPNPSSGKTEVRFFSEKPFAGQLSLSDLTGKTVMREAHAIGIGDQSLSFDMTGLPTGLYFAKMAAPTGLSFSFKVIKR